MRGPRCDVCGEFRDPDVAHLVHEVNCNRILDGACRCDEWSCADCCVDDSCVTPLAATVREAHDLQVAAAADLCEHHECPGMAARWEAVFDRQRIGVFCGEHLGDGIDDFDVPVTLRPLVDV